MKKYEPTALIGAFKWHNNFIRLYKSSTNEELYSVIDLIRAIAVQANVEMLTEKELEQLKIKEITLIDIIAILVVNPNIPKNIKKTALEFAEEVLKSNKNPSLELICSFISSNLSFPESQGFLKEVFQKLGSSKNENIEVVNVYLIGCRAENTIKIGVSSNVEVRLKSLQTSNANKLEILDIIENGGYQLESLIHQEFDSLRIQGEWFKWSEKIIQKFKLLNQQM